MARRQPLQQPPGGGLQTPPVTTEIMKEARRYQTVDTVTSWPLVYNTSTELGDYYTSLKKRSDSGRLVLSFAETLLGLYCRLIVLPVARSPFARTPLKIGDHFSIKGVRLLERAVPRLKDKADPMSLDGELLVTALFLPLSLCLASARGVLQWAAQQYVSVFPPLREAARDFDTKSLLGQWVTLLLMTYIYLPLQFVSHPSETLQHAFAVPSRVTWAVVNWNIGNILAVLHEVSDWVQWTSDTAAYCFYAWLGLVIAATEYAYYICFKVTGLESSLMSLVKMVRDYIERGDGAIARLISSLAQTPAGQWVSDVFAHSELGLVRLLRAIWYGADGREELKRNRRPGGRSVRLALPEEGPRPLPMPDTDGHSSRHNDH
ncbi:uncharacterized protein LOC122394335 [Amphibalanus amphitrite]|uniref:uncharacterized protein LOC122394335 n=1 Tax=Amphibalanus amphitrite TaxID=1232801 RepID=UPI001C902E43|nr:uncharacterized protein LOC122394335 [Amphibalanus amphitrite]XP_043247074.1 uncharacterized protein LOC122394335 [Amphibalanus amphitrite]